MNETLLVTLIGAALTGLTIIAYKHPHGYSRIFSAIAPGLAIAFGVMVLWSASSFYALIGIAHENLQRYSDQPLKDHSFAVQELFDTRESLKIFLLYFVPAVAYLIFLRNLPRILGLDDRGSGKRI